jgi:hypothetical protein
MTRFRFIQIALAGVGAWLSDLHAAADQMIVYRVEGCACCLKWVDHLRKNGFQVTVQSVPSTAEYRRQYGVPEDLKSCHTGVVRTYAIEGHVPASEIQRLLREQPDAKGLAVPGMPLGSPGMEADRSQAYSVLLFDAEGRTSVYQQYPAR